MNIIKKIYFTYLYALIIIRLRWINMASNKNGMYFIAGVCNDKSEVIKEVW